MNTVTRFSSLSGRLSGVLMVWLVFGTTGRAAQPVTIPPGTTPKEEELGKEAAKEVAKRYKFVKDKAALKRMQAMLALIVPRTPRPNIHYDVHIIDDDVVNAFTLPGGHIYVTKQLLKVVRSDDELAAVLAHEVGHNARMHVLRMIARQKKLQIWELLAVVGMMAGGKSADVGQMGVLVLNGILNGYSQQAEREADESAITFLTGTKYSPVGLLTFMEYLWDKEQRSPDIGDLGIYQTHPLTRERIRYIEARLRKLGIPLNRWRTARGLVATAEKAPETQTKAGPSGTALIAQVKLGKTTVCRLADDAKLTRAQNVVRRLNRALARNAGMYSVAVTSTPTGPALVWGGQQIVRVLPRDVHALNAPSASLAREWAANLKAALWRDSVTSRD